MPACVWLFCIVSSAYSKRTPDKTSPTGSTPYSDLKESRESVVEEKTREKAYKCSVDLLGRPCFEIGRKVKKSFSLCTCLYTVWSWIQHGPSTVVVTVSGKKHLDFSMTIRMVTVTEQVSQIPNRQYNDCSGCVSTTQ